MGAPLAESMLKTLVRIRSGQQYCASAVSESRVLPYRDVDIIPRIASTNDGTSPAIIPRRTFLRY
jgi:hypothetical protein